MICPHCNKPIRSQNTPEIKAQVLKLHKQGYSLRDIEQLLDRKISFSTVRRILKEKEGS